MKLIAIDLDGTLLNNHSEINEENVSAIHYAQHQGIEVVIATGRAYFDAQSILNKAGITTHVISYNGASIHSKTGEQLLSVTMNKDIVNQIVRWLDTGKYYYEVSTNNGIYTLLNSRELLQKEVEGLKTANPELDTVRFQDALEKQFSQFGFVFVNKYDEILNKDEEFYNILACSFDEEKRKNGVNQFKGMEQLAVVSSADNNFELVNKNASKGNSVKLLADMLNISLEQTMAIGDSYNDVSMLEKVNYSVAMGNAKADIKALCKYTTYTNEQNGVAHVIHNFIKIS